MIDIIETRSLNMKTGNITQINLDTIADFTFNFGGLFLMETEHGFFVWDSPDYGEGKNTIRPYKGEPRHFTHRNFCGRCKGTHQIRKYCGEDVVFSDEVFVDGVSMEFEAEFQNGKKQKKSNRNVGAATVTGQ